MVCKIKGSYNHFSYWWWGSRGFCRKCR